MHTCSQKLFNQHQIVSSQCHIIISQSKNTFITLFAYHQIGGRSENARVWKIRVQSRRVTTSRISRISLKAICLTYGYLILIMSSSYIYMFPQNTLYFNCNHPLCYFVIHPLRENGFRAENKMIQKSKGRVVA